ncbi:polysaccharide deacetylase family protein [Mesorhizobium xinjiangense]|uniref:polysaccharide deacetylase family protein n=1 Tax=Mesorhizobium xinjiangense TaxID=2678685 RepID=UPI0012ED06AE|nr:polysaccharide deacetylase family protein [Mesorhizobium xinjiangense]
MPGNENRTCHVSLTVNLQGMSVDRRKHGEDAAKHFGGKAHGRYMASTGAERLFSMFDDLGLKATVFVPGSEALEHPELVQAIAAAGHEIAAHGFAHEDYVGGEDEAALLARTHEILSNLIGAVPKGWRAPTGLLERATLSALADLGYVYDASNQDDDFPYRLDDDGAPGMIELPQHEMLTDQEHYERRATHDKLMKWWREEFFALHAERCYAQITVSPRADYGSGRASRVAALRGFLEEIRSLDGVRIGPCRDALAAIGTGDLFCRS